MLYDLDKTLEAMLATELPQGILGQDKPSISFATPDDRFPPAWLSLPTVNLFLFELQENQQLRDPEPVVARQDDGSFLKRPPLIWVDCHYLITACSLNGSQTPEQDEHRILGAAMQVLLRHRRIPAGYLYGTLKGMEPLPRAMAIRPTTRQFGMELWQSLRGKPRASLHYTVTLGMAVQPEEQLDRVREGKLILRSDPERLPEPLQRKAGWGAGADEAPGR